MGFLIGEKTSVTTQIVSDEDMEVERINTTISECKSCKVRCITH